MWMRSTELRRKTIWI